MSMYCIAPVWLPGQLTQCKSQKIICLQLCTLQISYYEVKRPNNLARALEGWIKAIQFALIFK